MSGILRLAALGGGVAIPPRLVGTPETTTASGALNTLTPTLPAGIVPGELLFVLVAFGRATGSIRDQFPWQLGSGSAAWNVEQVWGWHGGSTWNGAFLCWRIATGTDTLVLERATAEQFSGYSARAWRIAGGASVSLASTIVGSTLVAINPPSLALGASQPRLWGAGAIGTLNGTITEPSGWTDPTVISVAGSPNQALAWRRETAATLDPPAWAAGGALNRIFLTWAVNGPSAQPEPPFVWSTDLLFRFAASEGVFSDTGGTVPAAAGEGVAVWQNLGSGANTGQATAARRPIFRTGGLAGRPYLECDAAQQHFLDNLAFSHPTGVGTLSAFTIFAVTDAVDVSSIRPLVSHETDVINKGSVYFRPPAAEQLHLVKGQVRGGNVANPQVLVGRAAGAAAGPFLLRQFPGHVTLWNSTQITNLPSPATTELWFLRGISSGTVYFHGRLYELLFYAGALQDNTVNQIQKWLCRRYGISFA